MKYNWQLGKNGATAHDNHCDISCICDKYGNYILIYAYFWWSIEILNIYISAVETEQFTFGMDQWMQMRYICIILLLYFISGLAYMMIFHFQFISVSIRTVYTIPNCVLNLSILSV